MSKITVNFEDASLHYLEIVGDCSSVSIGEIYLPYVPVKDREETKTRLMCALLYKLFYFEGSEAFEIDEDSFRGKYFSNKIIFTSSEESFHNDESTAYYLEKALYKIGAKVDRVKTYGWRGSDFIVLVGTMPKSPEWSEYFNSDEWTTFCKERSLQTPEDIVHSLDGGSW